MKCLEVEFGLRILTNILIIGEELETILLLAMQEVTNQWEFLTITVLANRSLSQLRHLSSA